jgi:hypothetical protein
MGSGFIWFCYFVRLTPPELGSLDEYMDFLIPKIRYFGEDLAEEHFYVRKRWLEFKPNNPSVVLHIFEPSMQPNDILGGNHMKVIDGDVSGGEWSYLKGNKFIFKHPNQVLYDLGFLNPYIFIIRKHGTNQVNQRAKYIILVSEGGIRSIMSQALGTSEVSVETIAELLYHYYYFNNFIRGALIIGIPVFILILYILF